MDLLSGKITDDDFKHSLAAIENALRCGRPSFQITDLTLVTDAPPSQRRIAGEWTERTAPLQREWSLGGAVVAPSAFLRGAITAIHWLKQPPSPTFVCATRYAAIEHAIKVLEKAGHPVSDEIRALEARSHLRAAP